MALAKPLISTLLRGFQFLFAIISLALAGSVLSDLGFNWDRMSYVVAVGVLNIVYFFYILIVVPFGLNGQSPSLVILIGESIFMIFYLAAWAATADGFPTHCGRYSAFDYYNYNGFDSSTCRAYQAVLPFTLFNWFLFIASLVLFILYTLVPQVKTFGFNNTIGLTNFHFGAIFSDNEGLSRKRWFGTWGKTKRAEDVDEEKVVGNGTIQQDSEEANYQTQDSLAPGEGEGGAAYTTNYQTQDPVTNVPGTDTSANLNENANSNDNTRFTTADGAIAHERPQEGYITHPSTHSSPSEDLDNK